MTNESYTFHNVTVTLDEGDTYLAMYYHRGFVFVMVNDTDVSHLPVEKEVFESLLNDPMNKIEFGIDINIIKKLDEMLDLKTTSKTVKILGMGEVTTEQNEVSRVDYYDALSKVAKWSGLPPYKITKAIDDLGKSLNTCPDCDTYLHETNTDPAAPRTDYNALKPFAQGEYSCKKCIAKQV